jgi:hypothetical protein
MPRCMPLLAPIIQVAHSDCTDFGKVHSFAVLQGGSGYIICDGTNNAILFAVVFAIMPYSLLLSFRLVHCKPAGTARELSQGSVLCNKVACIQPALPLSVRAPAP